MRVRQKFAKNNKHRYSNIFDLSRHVTYLLQTDADTMAIKQVRPSMCFVNDVVVSRTSEATPEQIHKVKEALLPVLSQSARAKCKDENGYNLVKMLDAMDVVAFEVLTSRAKGRFIKKVVDVLKDEKRFEESKGNTFNTQARVVEMAAEWSLSLDDSLISELVNKIEE